MKKTSRFQLAFAVLILFVAAQNTAGAGIVNIGYTFDGTNMTLTNGPDLFAQNMSVGDTINLTFTADGAASYWDFSSVGDVFSANLVLVENATRGSEGFYEAKLNGATVLYNPYYNVPFQGAIHLGPDTVNWSSVTALDQFAISYKLLSSTSVNNNIRTSNGAPYDVYQLFHANVHGASFVHVPGAVVPEPSSLAIFGLASLGLVAGGIRRRKQKS